MKKYIYYSLLAVVAIVLASCEKFTDLKPKGVNLLSNTSDLELLLNYDYYGSPKDWQVMAGDFSPTGSNLETVLNEKNRSKASYILAWDDSDMAKYASFTPNDDGYEGLYKYIGRIANVILLQVDKSNGDEQLKKQLKCEALTLRAFSYWLLVNRFAKAYNPATAAQDPGIPYADENSDLLAPLPKLTVQQIYDHILSDLQQAIDLDGLPEESINQMRLNKACAHAVKAWALMCMQRFDEAEAAAQAALAVNGEIDDYNQMTHAETSRSGKEYQIFTRPRMGCKEDYFYIEYFEFFRNVTKEAFYYFEKGHTCRDHFDYDVVSSDYAPGWSQKVIGEFYPTTYDFSSKWNFYGIKSTHMYLMLAECALHKGNVEKAMEILDKIRIKRIDAEHYAPLQGRVTDEAEAIEYLKKSSHGENMFSAFNFIQRKRWNQLEKYRQTYTREIAGKQYHLTPESKFWIFPFPSKAAALNPNLLPQNYENL